MIYLLLFWEFFKTGLFAIGGGLATLPFLYDISAKYGWFSHGELTDMIAIAESTPGPIGVNAATYAGITAAGIPGGIVATFAIILPSFLIILLIAAVLTRFRENPFVQSSLEMIRPVSVGLIGAAVFSVVKVALLRVERLPEGGFWSLFDLPSILLCAALFLLLWKWKKLHPVVVVAIGAAVGILLKM